MRVSWMMSEGSIRCSNRRSRRTASATSQKDRFPLRSGANVDGNAGSIRLPGRPQTMNAVPKPVLLAAVYRLHGWQQFRLACVNRRICLNSSLVDLLAELDALRLGEQINRNVLHS